MTTPLDDAWCALNALENLGGNILFDQIPHERIADIADAAAKYLRAFLEVGNEYGLTQCPHPDCATWQSRPCGEGCYWRPPAPSPAA